MAIRIFRTMDEYVAHATSIEEDVISTLVASSYLSSHLFSKDALLRFFEQDSGNIQAAKIVSNNLWRRRKRIHSNMKNREYREIYELDALDTFCKQGIVHRQASKFKATHKEILQTLESILTLVKDRPLYQVAFCREVLPFIFIVKVGKELIIDVRNNFGYQKIQGLVIDDDQIVAEFQKEFWRIWNESTSISDRKEVVKLLTDKLSALASGNL